MLVIMQIMSHLLNHYSAAEVETVFLELEQGERDIDTFLDEAGVELSGFQRVSFEEKLAKWPSALAVIKMKRGA